MAKPIGRAGPPAPASPARVHATRDNPRIPRHEVETFIAALSAAQDPARAGLGPETRAILVGREGRPTDVTKERIQMDASPSLEWLLVIEHTVPVPEMDGGRLWTRMVVLRDSDGFDLEVLGVHDFSFNAPNPTACGHIEVTHSPVHAPDIEDVIVDVDSQARHFGLSALTSTRQRTVWAVNNDALVLILGAESDVSISHDANGPTGGAGELHVYTFVGAPPKTFVASSEGGDKRYERHFDRESFQYTTAP